MLVSNFYSPSFFFIFLHIFFSFFFCVYIFGCQLLRSYTNNNKKNNKILLFAFRLPYTIHQYIGYGRVAHLLLLFTVFYSNSIVLLVFFFIHFLASATVHFIFDREVYKRSMFFLVCHFIRQSASITAYRSIFNMNLHIYMQNITKKYVRSSV